MPLLSGVRSVAIQFTKPVPRTFLLVAVLRSVLANLASTPSLSVVVVSVGMLFLWSQGRSFSSDVAVVGGRNSCVLGERSRSGGWLLAVGNLVRTAPLTLFPGMLTLPTRGRRPVVAWSSCNQPGFRCRIGGHVRSGRDRIRGIWYGRLRYRGLYDR